MAKNKQELLRREKYVRRRMLWAFLLHPIKTYHIRKMVRNYQKQRKWDMQYQHNDYREQVGGHGRKE